ncbi:glutamate--tRNA ligase [Candidatus Woesearchaeota archaeon]|nr:glutamate--tRNA ligase [Candidatus Woesearchaeota archaeon]
MEDLLYKYALQNAVKYNGKANPGALIGKILAEKPELKSDIENLKKRIQEVVNKVNSMSLDTQLTIINKIAPELLEEKKEEKKDLKELPGAIKGNFVTRIPPEPSKYTHLGHALSFLINYVYALKYNGKCYMRYEDANPEKVSKEYVDAMEYDIKKYLDIKPEKTTFVSDHMELMYQHALDLINRNEAYVCSCSQEVMRNLRHKGEACWCRHRSKDDNLKDWNLMVKKKFREGERTLRLKIDMTANNQVLRDPVIFRLDYHKHYRKKTKYCSWPTYDFYNVIEDNLVGVNYILKSNEFGTMRTELHNHIRKLFNFAIPNEFQYGRFNVNDKISQGREIRELIKEGKVKNWDDPRLITLSALRRRGIVKETFYELVKEVGLTKTETNLDFEVVAAINRRLLDKKCNRYFFIHDPIKLKIENVKSKSVKLGLHPDFPKRGSRKFKINEEFYLINTDFKKLTSDKIHRLMDCLNFIKEGNKFIFHSWSYDNFKNATNKGVIIHWLPVNDSLINVDILMDDATILKGIAESNIKKLKLNEIIQFERFGFVKLEKKGNEYNFVFCHK